MQELDKTAVSVWGVTAHGGLLAYATSFYPLTGLWVIDVENNPDGSCAGVGVSNDGRIVHFMPAEAVTELPKAIFKQAELVGHNIKYDVQMLRKWGFEVSADQIVWDTQLAEYVKDSSKNRYGLKKLVKDIFGTDYPDFKTLTGTGKKAVSIGSLPLEIVANYNGCDVLFTYKLMQKQFSEMTEEQKTYMETIELPAMRALLETEERGVEIDTNYIRGIDTGFRDELSRLVLGIRNSYKTEINLNSWQQVKQLLLDAAGLQVPNTAAETLEKHQHLPLVKSILRYRALSKLIGTYTGPLAACGSRVHARFNQTVTITGRLSSSEPNLQNIPTRTEEGAKVRKAFIAKEGHMLLDVDYSQIQPSLMAHYSQDPKMLEVFRTGKSIYSLVTDICQLNKELKLDPKETKAVAKVLWLALAFNAGAYALSIQSGLSIDKCYKFIDRMERELGAFFYWKNKTIGRAQIDGYVTTLFGRRIPIDKEWAHLGPNYIIQGGESEIMKLAQHVTRHLNPVIPVHDELLFEIPKGTEEAATKEIRSLMSEVVILSVPLRVEIGTGPNWAEAKN